MKYTEEMELQPTAGPLDRVDTRGFLTADLYELTQLSATDAQKLGKRVQERAAAARKEIAAKEKAARVPAGAPSGDEGGGRGERGRRRRVGGVEGRVADFSGKK